MATKANTLRIHGDSNIILENANGKRGGFRWTGAELRHASGRAMRFSPALTAEIAAAVAEARPARYEHRSGAQVADSGDRGGWVFSGVRGDAVGMYSRLVSAAVVPTVSFDKEDLA